MVLAVVVATRGLAQESDSNAHGEPASGAECSADQMAYRTEMVGPWHKIKRPRVGWATCW